MKYKVGDKVVWYEPSGIITDINEKEKKVFVYWEDENELWCKVEHIQPDYCALYEQEKAIRMAAEKMLCDQADMTIDEWMEAFDNYQQLKQQYNGKET